MINEQRYNDETLISGRKSLPSVKAWLEVNRSRFKPGSVLEILIMHDHSCRYPWGEPCTCLPGPEIKLAGENPECN
jgi:hypothetical protein